MALAPMPMPRHNTASTTNDGFATRERSPRRISLSTSSSRTRGGYNDQQGAQDPAKMICVGDVVGTWMRRIENGSCNEECRSPSVGNLADLERVDHAGRA